MGLLQSVSLYRSGMNDIRSGLCLAMLSTDYIVASLKFLFSDLP